MNDLREDWKRFVEFADEHNSKQPGYPGYFENGIVKDFRTFMVWLNEQDNQKKA